MPLSDFDIKNMDRIMVGHGDWFTAQLLRLIAKADEDNIERLRKGFPEEVEIVGRWCRGELNKDEKQSNV